MAFNVNYNAGGVVDEIKKIKAILGGIIDEVKQIDTILGGTIDLVKVVDKVNKVGNVEKVETVSTVETVKQVDNIDKVKIVEDVKQVDNVSNVELVEEVDNVKTVDTVTKVQEVGKILNFPTLSQPFSEMVKVDMPALEGDYEAEYITPDKEVEIVAMTVTASGYSEKDYYDIYVNDKIWFKNWYTSEVKEGLFLGSSTFVYKALPNTKIKLVYHNVSGTSKVVWLGIRMLTE